MFNDGTPEYRFAPPGPRDEPRPLVFCAHCDEYICEGEEVALDYEGDYVHDACLAYHLRERYVKERGVIGADGTID